VDLLIDAKFDAAVLVFLMNLTLAHIGARPGSKDELGAFIEVYLGRCAAFAHCRTEAFRTEEAMLKWLERLEGRTPAVAVLLDSRGRQMTSEGFATWLGKRRDAGTQQIVFAVGSLPYGQCKKETASCCLMLSSAADCMISAVGSSCG
jgi:23S rRNA pseudoU1915 N3-methylase RlmH